jgi:hypothetical protein
VPLNPPMTVYSIEESRDDRDQVVNHGMSRILIDPININYTCLHALKAWEESRNQVCDQANKQSRRSIAVLIALKEGPYHLEEHQNEHQQENPTIISVLTYLPSENHSTTMPASTPNPKLTQAYVLASQTYTLRNPTSHSLHLPGGNTRTTLHYAPPPSP